MTFRHIIRILVCLLLALLLQVGLVPEGMEHESPAALYPADGLRHLSVVDSRDRKIRPGRAYNQMAGLKKYSELMQRHAGRIGMDWRLLAAIIFQESQYNIGAESNKSAKGLMQIRDVTAEHYGVPAESLFDPDTNVLVGTRLLADLLRSFQEEGLDSVNVMRFALASYNSGGGALARRREEAAEAGLDPNNWEDVAEIYRRTSNITPAYITAIEETYASYLDTTTVE